MLMNGDDGSSRYDSMKMLRSGTVDECLKRIEDVIRSMRDLDQAQIPVSYSILNSYLSEPVVSRNDLPAAPTSSMDGYAVHLHPDPRYEIVATLRAGADHRPLMLNVGEAAYVTTGSRIPPGADAVVPVELTSIPNHHQLTLLKAHDLGPGSFIRQTGQDIHKGQELLAGSCKIQGTELALLISSGIDQVSVYRHIRVGVCSSGDELIDFNQPLTDETIHVRDSNRPMIISYLQQLNEPIDVVDLGIVRDQLQGSSDSIYEKLQNAANELDVIITTGGISMGSHDLLKQYLHNNTIVHFQGIQMKPGKPTMFAQSNDCVIFALPGNPLSASCNFHLFVKPALKLLSSQRSADKLHTTIMCRLRGQYPCDNTRPVYQFAWVYWDHNSSSLVAVPTVHSSDCAGSSRLLTAQQANGIIHSPVQKDPVQDGQILPVTLIAPLDHSLPCRLPAHTGPGSSDPVHHHCPHSQTHSSGNHFERDSAITIKACLLICSDRAYRGEYQDKSGPAASKFLTQRGIEVIESIVVPDDDEMIRNQIMHWTDQERTECDVVFTIGGTGLSPRDVTPDVTAPLLHKSLPALVWAMVSDGRRHTPYALLSRASAGVRFKTLVVNLVGSVKGCVENLSSVVEVLPHAVALIRQGSRSQLLPS